MAPKRKITPELYSLRDVCAVLGVGRSTVYHLIAHDPSFPTRIQIARRAIRWRRTEIEQWVLTRPALAS